MGKKIAENDNWGEKFFYIIREFKTEQGKNREIERKVREIERKVREIERKVREIERKVREIEKERELYRERKRDIQGVGKEG